MTHRDARSLDHETLEEMRRLAVKAVLDGESHRAVARRLQVQRTTVTKWMAWFGSGGEVALASKKAKGRSPTLSDREVAWLRRIIIGKNPRQLNFGPALWTLRLIGQLVEMKFGAVLHKTTIWRMMGRLGITPQKPIRKAFQRDEEECRHWMTEEFPRIVRLALRKQAVILFGDETGIHEDHAVGTTWGAKGRTPVVSTVGTRRRTNVISAISPRGRLWFRCYRGTLTASLYIEFLDALLQDVRGPIVLIHDRHPSHIAAATRRFIRSYKGRLWVYELPAYAPHLNPDEHVWSWLKGRFRQDPLGPEDDLSDRVERTLAEIQGDRTKVRGLFEHPQVKYVKEALHW